jgi:hypothetical protein
MSIASRPPFQCTIVPKHEKDAARQHRRAAAAARRRRAGARRRSAGPSSRAAALAVPPVCRPPCWPAVSPARHPRVRVERRNIRSTDAPRPRSRRWRSTGCGGGLQPAAARAGHSQVAVLAVQIPTNKTVFSAVQHSAFRALNLSCSSLSGKRLGGEEHGSFVPKAHSGSPAFAMLAEQPPLLGILKCMPARCVRGTALKKSTPIGPSRRVERRAVDGGISHLSPLSVLGRLALSEFRKRTVPRAALRPDRRHVVGSWQPIAQATAAGG